MSSLRPTDNSLPALPLPHFTFPGNTINPIFFLFFPPPRSPANTYSTVDAFIPQQQEVQDVLQFQSLQMMLVIPRRR